MGLSARLTAGMVALIVLTVAAAGDGDPRPD
jgi:hypothetical protein